MKKFTDGVEILVGKHNTVLVVQGKIIIGPTYLRDSGGYNSMAIHLPYCKNDETMYLAMYKYSNLGNNVRNLKHWFESWLND